MSRSKTKKSKNYLIKVIVSFVVVAVSALATASALHFVVPSGMVATVPGNCQRGSILEVCLTIDKTDVAASETLKLVTTIENISDEAYEASFGCDDTAPGVMRNGEVMTDMLAVCATVITTVDIPAGDSRIYEEKLDAYRLGAGEHRISTGWQAVSSGEVLVNVTDDSQRPLTEQEQACLRGVDSPVCTDIHFGVSDEVYASYDEMTCEDFDGFVSNLELTHSATKSKLCDLGSATYHVPKSRYNYYLSEIERIEKAQS